MTVVFALVGLIVGYAIGLHVSFRRRLAASLARRMRVTS